MDPTNEINVYLKRMKNGEPCFDDFFNAVSGYIKFIGYKYLIDKSFVSDVVMNTFCKILDNIQAFDERQNGKAWISRIAQNEAYAINARERKHSHISLDDAHEEIACTIDAPESLEFVAALEKALIRLDETDRTIVELRVFEDMTFEQIAHRLNMYVGTVHKRFKRSVAQINKDIF